MNARWITTRCALALGLIHSACGGAQPNMPADKSGQADQALKLDIQDEWTDPEADLSQAAAPLGRDQDPPDARVNPHAGTIAIVGGTVLTAAGKRFDEGMVLLVGGRIEYVGDASRAVPHGATIIDAKNRFITPGIIDAHSHIGVYALPGVKAHRDGNELTAPLTPHVRAEYGYWPQDPAIPHALASGVTTALILPGSGNLIGGQGFTVAMRPARTPDEVRFPGAPPTIKMACGENPKNVYGEKGGPASRMALYAAFRKAFHEARLHNARWSAYERERAVWTRKYERAQELDAEAEKAGEDGRVAPVAAPTPPTRDLAMETLGAVLRGEVLVQVHCYRSSDIAQMVAIANEFGFRIRSFHHSLEAYKVRDMLVANEIAINTWTDWWGFKLEAFDGIPENAALFTESGGRAVIHSDSPELIQRLNQEAAKAMYAGRRGGVAITEDQALRWITANPAWVMGIHEVTGTLEAGKRADVVVWSHHPLSVYARADEVIQAGELVYQRTRGVAPTDFELGNSSGTALDGTAAQRGVGAAQSTKQTAKQAGGAP